MQLRRNRGDGSYFLGCSNYHETGCKFSHSLPDDADIHGTITAVRPPKDKPEPPPVKRVKRPPLPSWKEVVPELRLEVLKVLAGTTSGVLSKELERKTGRTVPCRNLWGNFLTVLKGLGEEKLIRRNSPKHRTWYITAEGKKLVFPQRLYDTIDKAEVYDGILDVLGTDEDHEYQDEELMDLVGLRLRTAYPPEHFRANIEALEEHGCVERLPASSIFLGAFPDLPVRRWRLA